MMFLASIIIIGAVQGLNLMINKKYLRIMNIIIFIFELIFSYFNLMMAGKLSNFLAKLKRHYLMYFIPLLSIIVVNVMTYSIYSNMISPPKQWCKSIECFAQSNYRFHVANDYTMNLL